MKKEINNQKKAKNILKSILVALGVAVAAKSCSVVTNIDQHEEIHMENDEQGNDNNLHNTTSPSIPNENLNDDSDLPTVIPESEEKSDDIVQSTEEEKTEEKLDENPKYKPGGTEKKKKNPKPEEKPGETNKPTEEQKPEEKPGETNKPTEEQKPEEKPSETNKPTEEQKPEEKPGKPPKPEDQHHHSYGEWGYYSDEKEAKICASCGDIVYRNHIFSDSSQVSVISNNNGTHTRIEIKKCNNCEYKVVLENEVSCNFGSWTYNISTKLEERICNDCGYKETRVHNHQSSSNDLTYVLDRINNNGTHTLKAIYTCSMCNEIITLYKEENCKYNAWTSSDAVSCTKECSVCGDDVIKNHNFSVVSGSLTSNPTIGLHNIMEKCNDCGYERQVTVACTGDGNKYFYELNGIITERENCSLCNDVCIQSPHNHTYGNYISVDDSIHKRICACGNESTEAHNYGSWIVTGDGTNTRTCSTCNNVETVTHTCSLKEHIESCGTAQCCYMIITKCEIDGCTYETRVPVGHNFHVESNMFGSIYTCYDCGYSYEEAVSSLSNDSISLEEENEKGRQLVLTK